MRFLSGDVVTVYSLAKELGIPGQALAAYNGFRLDQPVASNFPIVLPTVEETMSMTGETLGNVSGSTVATPAVLGIAQDKDLSLTIERFAQDDQSLDDSLTQKVHDALVASIIPERTLQSIVHSIVLIPSNSGFGSIEEGATFRSLKLNQVTGYADGSFS